MKDVKPLLEPYKQRQLAQRVLDLLVVLCQSEVGAVFRVNGHDTPLHASTSIEQDVLDWARADWFTADPGTPIVHERRTFLFFPCTRDGDVVGFAYVEATATPPAAKTRALLDLLTDATAAPGSEVGQQADEDQRERERLLYLCHHNDWNLARVARLEGVTRKTIYRRLDHHGIDRLRVKLKPRLV